MASRPLLIANLAPARPARSGGVDATALHLVSAFAAGAGLVLGQRVLEAAEKPDLEASFEDEARQGLKPGSLFACVCGPTEVAPFYKALLSSSFSAACTAEKSNEITPIPELLSTLALTGCTVTIDAMGTQTAIAEAIQERGADYVLAVKDNQPKLAESIEDF